MALGELNGQIALVTGASRGIGAAIARMLGQQSSFVIGTATTTAGTEKIEQMLADEGLSGKAYPLDFSDRASLENFSARLADDKNLPDILVNNAGITRDRLLLGMKEIDWSTVLTVNLDSVYRLCKLCLSNMVKKRRGRIINISSVSGLTGNAGQCNYAAAKAGVIGFTRSLAREVAQRGITVNAVAPGFIQTDMTAGIPEELLASIPLARMGQPEEVASVVAFLASAQATYITGETINVSGGLYIA